MRVDDSRISLVEPVLVSLTIRFKIAGYAFLPHFVEVLFDGLDFMSCEQITEQQITLPVVFRFEV